MAAIIKYKNKAYDFLTNPKIVKNSLWVALVFFFPLLIISLIVAQFDPDGFNFVDNFVSDMGSFNHTPAPYIWDYDQMITAILLVPFTFYMEKIIAPIPEKAEDFERMRFRLSSAGLCWMILGLIGFFGVGLFSEDRSNLLAPIGLPGLHSLFSVVVFLCIGIAAIFFGLVIVFYDTILPRLLGVFMIFVPFTLAVSYFSTMYKPLEWILMLSLFIWIVPSSLIFIKHANEELTLKQ